MLNLMIMTATMSIIFMLVNHPLSMGLTLLIQTLLISMISGNMTQNFWYSYIIFIIMVGGMLVLFIYMTSIASNEKFKFSYSIMMWILTSLTITLILNFKEKFLNYITFKNYELIDFNLNKLISFSMNKYLNFPSNYMMIFLIIYLLIALIAVVKITKTKYGPLRQGF